MDPLKDVSVTLLVKLGSIAVHTEEMMSPKGHHFDKATLDALLNDPEVREWLEAMGAQALLPVKR